MKFEKKTSTERKLISDLNDDFGLLCARFEEMEDIMVNVSRRIATLTHNQELMAKILEKRK